MRLLTTELVRDVDGRVTCTTIRTNGWRIDITPGGTHMTHHTVHIANEALDGACAGWCACAYDATIPENTLGDLTLNGSESE